MKAETWTPVEVQEGANIKIHDHTIGDIAVVEPLDIRDGLTASDRRRARLIAAAPDLKEACEAALQALPDDPLKCNGMKCGESICAECNVEEDAQQALERVRDACTDALAKARGEEG